MKELLKRVSVFYRYLFSYIVLLLVPFIVISVFVFNNSVNALKDAAQSMYTYKLGIVTNDIEAQFYAMSQVAYDISQDKYFKYSFLKESSYNAIAMLENFKKYRSRSQIADDILYYFRDDINVYNSEGKYYYSTYMERFLDKTQTDELYKVMNQANKPVIMNLKTSDNKNTIFYIYPISVINSSISVPTASVVFVVNQDTLMERIQNVAGEMEGDIFIFFDKELLSYFTGDTRNIALAMKETEKVYPEDIGISEQKGMTLMNRTSSRGRYKVVLILSSIKFSETVDRLKNINWMILSGLAVACLLLGAALAYGNYRPIKLLEMDVKSWRATNTPQYKVGNEIDNISTVFQSARKNNDKLELRINEQNILIRHQTLMMLLNGSYGGKVADKMKEGNIRLNGPFYCVMSVRAKMEGARNDHVVNDIIIGCIHKLASENLEIYAVEHGYDECVAVICSLDDDSAETRKSIAGQIINICSEKDIDVLIGIGCAYDAIEKLRISFLEALSTDGVRETGSAGILFFEKLDKSFMQLVWYPSDEMMYIIQNIRMGDSRNAKDILQGMMGKIKGNVPSLLMRQCICFEIINNIMKTARDLKINIPSTEVSPVVTFKSMENFRSNMEALIEKICGEVAGRMQKKNSEQADSVVAYINSHYLEYDMSLKKLSDVFSLSINHLSRIVKERTGELFQDYLIDLRIAEAKKLLSEGKLNVNEICGAIGYANVSHFIKSFKKHVGMTPAIYKNALK